MEALMKNQEKVEASAAIADAIASLSSERAQKKAASRAAFIQEVAVATALLVCGHGIKRGPFAQAFHDWDMTRWRAEKVREANSDGLWWAIRQGLLPEDATLPSEEEQRRLLATLHQ
jgi:hypothetical protein